MIGQRLSHFEVLAKLGEGGMGEVYRARDTRLGRDVAIKVLPKSLQEDEEFRQRLAREAESISQLQHPHICALYDIGSENGVDFLVMELLEGETLEERLKRERLPIDEALAFAGQIAAALERAHSHGVVHRDLKPGNVMLTTDGCKVLDFGLATEFVSGKAAVATASPTVLMTGKNVIAGTIHYMAPEQLRGQPVDARTDIFALGCVLHEMLTGERPFDGESQANLIAAILEHEPKPLAALDADLPSGLGRVVERCLAKDPEQRWRSSGDVEKLLEDLVAGEFSGDVPTGSDSRAQLPTTRGRVAFAGALGTILGLLAGIWTAGLFAARKPTVQRVTIERFTVDETGDPELGELYNPALSRDGDKVAFVANSDAGLKVYLRLLEELTAHPVDGTDNAGWVTFSPDGEWLLFFDVVDRVLKKISIHGGGATEITRPSYLPATWGDDGYIYYPRNSVTSRGTADSKGLWRIAAEGGEPQQLTRAEAIPGTPRFRAHAGPQLLPGGRKLLFSVGDGYLHGNWDVALLDLETGDWRRVFEGANQVKMLAGHLVFWRDRRLWAAPFDPERQETLAVPRPVLDGIARHPLAPVELGQYQVTAAGDLVYVSGSSTVQEISRLVVAPFGGSEVELLSNPGERIMDPTLAPDKRHVAFERCIRFNSEDRDCRIWTVDLEGRNLAPFSRSEDTHAPLWEASGEALIFTELDEDEGHRRLLRQPLDGSGTTVLVQGPFESQLVGVASLRDGRLVYTTGTFSETEIRLLWPDGSSEILVEADRQMVTDLSPNGRWLVFHSDRSGQSEIYALDLDAEEARVQQITNEGALFGHFAPDGRSLYLRSRTYPGPAEILRAPFDPTTGRLGEPESVTATPAQGYTSSWWYLGLFDVTEDGLILAQLHTPPRSGRVVMVRNWATEMVERLR